MRSHIRTPWNEFSPDASEGSDDFLVGLFPVQSLGQILVSFDYFPVALATVSG
jgi:hypothetical protein